MSVTRGRTDPNQVICSGDGLNFGYMNQPIEALVDIRNAGPGELEVYCNGPNSQAFCELQEHEDGLFMLIIRATEPGSHHIFVNFSEKAVPGSPFNLRVSPASLVRVAGPGLYDGLRKEFKSSFQVDTKDVGHGDVKVRVGGPPGAFKLKTKKKGSTLDCEYRPKQSGIYVVNVIWQGDHVPGSPFHVFVCDTAMELERYRRHTTV